MTASNSTALRPAPPRILATGLEPLDEPLGGGITTRHVSAIIGPPGSGRTSLAIEIASATEAWDGTPILHVAGNQEAGEVMARYGAHLFAPAPSAAGAHAGGENQPPMTWRDIYMGQHRFVGGVARCLCVRVIDGFALHVGSGDLLLDIATAARELQGRYRRPPLLVIDQLEHLTHPGLAADRLVRGLRMLAQALDAAVIVTATDDDAERPAANALCELASNVIEIHEPFSHFAAEQRRVRLVMSRSLLGEPDEIDVLFAPATGRWGAGVVLPASATNS